VTSGLARHMAEHIWLRAFGITPKSCFIELQIRSKRDDQIRSRSAMADD
jgi:hypothetical protein